MIEVYYNNKLLLTTDKINHLHDTIHTKLLLKPQDYFLKNTKTGKILNANVYYFFTGPLRTEDHRYEIIPKLKGGVIPFMLLSLVSKPFRMIFNAFVLFYKAIIYIILLSIWIFKFLTWLFTDFLLSLPFDLVGMIGGIVKGIYYVVMDVIGFYLRNIINGLGNSTVHAIFGADNVKTQSGGGAGEEEETCRKCYRTEDGTVPFTVLIITILCPPIGVFMEYGVLGWFNILICSLLTLAFYFPGLLYALILLYC